MASPGDSTTALAEKVGAISLSSPPQKEETQKADLRFPHLNLSHHSSSGSGCITNEPLAKGLFGKVKFVQWNGFDKIMNETLAIVNSIPPEYHLEARSYFDICRKQANRIYGPPGSSKPMGGISTIRQSPAEPSCYAMTLMFEGDDPRKSFDVSSSLSMEKDIFEGIRELLRGIYRNDYEFEFPQRQFSLIGEQRYKSRKPIPDRALCTVSMNRMVSPPICAFEMKAPTVSFHSAVYNVCRFSLESSKDDDESSEDYDWIANRLCEGKGCKHEISAYALCKYFNVMFESVENPSKWSGFVSKQKRMMIAQTIVQALTTQTGCGFLFMYETGIAFELQRFNKKGQIVIRTSPLFCCGNRKGVGAAILTLSSFAVRKLSDDKASLNRVSKFVSLVVETAKTRQSLNERFDEIDSVSETDDSDKSTGKTKNSGVNESCIGMHTPIGSEGKTTGFSIKDNAGQSCIEGLDQVSEISEITDDREDEEMSHSEQSESTLDRLYRSRDELIGKGWTAMVFRAFWEGKVVALKVWNGEFEEGQLEIDVEACVYNVIRDKYHFLLGTAIPHLISAGPLSKHVGLYGATVVIATEFVGQGLYRDADGVLWISGPGIIKPVQSEDVRCIYFEALRSLKELHRHLIAHGDVALRNLRVERVNPSSTRWRAWWLDLGKATFEKDHSAGIFTSEERQCALLFHVGTKQFAK